MKNKTTLLTKTNSEHNSTIIVEDKTHKNETWRSMSFGGAEFTQSSVRLVDGQIDFSGRFDYITNMFAVIVFMTNYPRKTPIRRTRSVFGKDTNLLFVGLGAGVLPNMFIREFDNLNIDAVEIDRTVVELAIKYFDFGDNGKWRGDCYSFVQNNNRVTTCAKPIQLFETKRKYKTIVVDIGSDKGLPISLVKDVINKKLVGMMDENGFLVLNAFSETRTELRTIITYLKKLFVHVLCFSEGVKDANPVLVAHNNAPTSRKHILKVNNKLDDFDFDFIGTIKLLVGGEEEEV
jgi:hypothetical protein